MTRGTSDNRTERKLSAKEVTPTQGGIGVHAQGEADTTRKRRKASGQHNRAARSGQPRTTYVDCLAGRAATPTDPVESLLFQFLMVGGMVTFMATFNGMRHSGVAFLATHHWIYPLVACAALFLRIVLTNRVVDFLAPRLVFSHLQGFTATAAFTALNVAVMAPLMSLVTTLLLYGTPHYFANVAANLPVSAVVSFFVNLFVVAPAVKLLYNNYLTTARGARIFDFVERTAMPWMYLINS